jgi:hypothetical protein
MKTGQEAVALHQPTASWPDEMCPSKPELTKTPYWTWFKSPTDCFRHLPLHAPN